MVVPDQAGWSSRTDLMQPHTEPSILIGTYWYHSHLSTQYCDGLRGPFVVYDPNDPHAALYNVDDGIALLLLQSNDGLFICPQILPLSHWQTGSMLLQE